MLNLNNSNEHYYVHKTLYIYTCLKGGTGICYISLHNSNEYYANKCKSDIY